jgi:hypothetical protein
MHLAKQATPGFFTDYPDGYLLSVARLPLSWYESARRHSANYERFSDAIRLWMASAEASLSLRDQFPNRVILLTFEDLVGNCRAVMRRLCSILRLTYDDCLSLPTFDGSPIKSNSNFMPTFGVDQDVLRRCNYSPEGREEKRLLETALAVYERVLMSSVIRTDPPSAPAGMARQAEHGP